MHAIVIFSLLTAHATNMAMDNPPKEDIDPKVWQHLPPDMRNKVLITHFINTFESPEYTPNINVHIRNMRTVSKEYRNFIQKPQTMLYIFQQLEPVNKDIQNIFNLDPKFTFIKAIRTNNVPAINLSLIYNQVSNRLPLLLTHCDKSELTSTLQVITETNSFRTEELRSTLTQARKDRNIDVMKALYECQAPMEYISFIEELESEHRTPQTIQYIQQMVTDHFKKHVIWLFISDIYHCSLPITTSPLLCLAIGDYKHTKQLLKYGINPHNDTALNGNIVQKKDKCVALLLEHIIPNSSHLTHAVCSKNAFAVELILKKNKNICDQELRPLLIEAVINSDKETVKLLLEYIQDKQIKFDVFNMVKHKMIKHRSDNKKSKAFAMPHLKKKNVPVTSIFAIFCDNLGISFAQAIQNIDREIEAHND